MTSRVLIGVAFLTFNGGKNKAVGLKSVKSVKRKYDQLEKHFFRFIIPFQYSLWSCHAS